MSRVSSAAVKEKCIGGFFAAYPTPSAALDSDPGHVLDIIAPLGLFPGRMKSIISISERFIEMPSFDAGLDKHNKIYGLGEFGIDSYLIFSRGEGASLTPQDKNLRAFCSWLKTLDPSTVQPGVPGPPSIKQEPFDGPPPPATAPPGIKSEPNQDTPANFRRV